MQHVSIGLVAVSVDVASPRCLECGREDEYSKRRLVLVRAARGRTALAGVVRILSGQREGEGLECTFKLW